MGTVRPGPPCPGARGPRRVRRGARVPRRGGCRRLGLFRLRELGPRHPLRADRRARRSPRSARAPGPVRPGFHAPGPPAGTPAADHGSFLSARLSAPRRPRHAPGRAGEGAISRDARSGRPLPAPDVRARARARPVPAARLRGRGVSRALRRLPVSGGPADERRRRGPMDHGRDRVRPALARARWLGARGGGGLRHGGPGAAHRRPARARARPGPVVASEGGAASRARRPSLCDISRFLEP